MRDVDNGGDYVLEEGLGVYGNSLYLPLHFAVDSITALQTIPFFKSVYKMELYFYVPVKTKFLKV